MVNVSVGGAVQSLDVAVEAVGNDVDPRRVQCAVVHAPEALGFGGIKKRHSLRVAQQRAEPAAVHALSPPRPSRLKWASSDRP